MATGKLDVGQPDMFDVIAFDEGFLDLKVGLAGSGVLKRFDKLTDGLVGFIDGLPHGRMFVLYPKGFWFTGFTLEFIRDRVLGLTR
jgi:hypothetical protein